MKKIIFIGAFLLFAFSVNAQGYYTSIGIRGGMSQGVTVKRYISRIDAFEGIVAVRWGGFIVTGLYEFINEFKEPGLTWYYGFGAHVGHWSGKNNDPKWWEDRFEGGITVMGADGIIGIEYTFESTPLNISFDWKPAFNFVGYSGWWGDQAALSIRFIIN